MENLTQEKVLNVNNKSFNNYHCRTCGEIPLLHFSHYDFDLICITHSTLNIPIDDLFNHITSGYECSTCKQSSNENNIYYCYQCNKYFCDKCINIHNNNKNKSHNIINANNKNIKCELHNKFYDKYCFKCKLNLCELCEKHNEHYVELFKDVYFSDEDMNHFYEKKQKVLNDLEKKEKENDESKDSEHSYISEEEKENIIKQKIELKTKFKKLKEYVEIKTLFIKTFSRDITNYNYINNVNNIIRCLYLIYHPSFINDEIKNISYSRTNDKNSIENKRLIKSMYFENRSSSVWCMKKLNIIEFDNKKKLELIALGNARCNIILINLLNFQIYQIINDHKGTVYSFDQYKDDSKYLFSSSEDASINVYTLDMNYKYKLIQTLKKSEEKKGEEINKVITLSNKLLVSSDHRSITIWKSNSYDENKINYEDYFEIIVNNDTCHLLEVNPSVFVATQYRPQLFQVYKNDGNCFPLLSELKNTFTHGNSSNALAKINDNLVCSGAKSLFYLISIEPLQIIQKIIFENDYFTLYFMHITKDNYLYHNIDYGISQYKIINDEDNNFHELKLIGNYCQKNYFNNEIITERIVLPIDDGRIILISDKKGIIKYQLIS